MPAPENTQRKYKYYDFVMAAFVTVGLCSNLIGAAKVAQVHLGFLGTYTFASGVLFFPISYIFGDVLTEVYGYARARRVVWAGFTAQAFAAFMAFAILKFPPAPGWPNQAAYETVFGATPRIVVASLIAFFCGEFTNSFILAKMKILTRGKMLWARTIGSTIGGEAVDSIIFYPLAFYGLWPNSLLITVLITNYCIKVGWEAAVTPVTYIVVNFLKKKENEDFYDYETKFTPFSLDVK